jgi:oxaloacetate decarboxylase gamma subunit
MEVNLVTEGVKFMILGMSVVFAFLTLLIFILKIQSKIIHKYFAKSDSATSGSSAATAAAGAVATSGSAGGEGSQNQDGEIVAAITAAITDFRKS